MITISPLWPPWRCFKVCEILPSEYPPIPCILFHWTLFVWANRGSAEPSLYSTFPMVRNLLQLKRCSAYWVSCRRLWSLEQRWMRACVSSIQKERQAFSCIATFCMFFETLNTGSSIVEPHRHTCSTELGHHSLHSCATYVSLLNPYPFQFLKN